MQQFVHVVRTIDFSAVVQLVQPAVAKTIVNRNCFVPMKRPMLRYIAAPNAESPSLLDDQFWLTDGWLSFADVDRLIWPLPVNAKLSNALEISTIFPMD